MDQYETFANAIAEFANAVVSGDMTELIGELAHQTMAVLPVAGVAIAVHDADGVLQAVACTSDQISALERHQIETGTGPSVTTYRTGSVVALDDLAQQRETWPDYAARSLDLGFRSTVTLPLRRGDERLGAITLLSVEAGSMTPADISVGQALADITTASIRYQRLVERAELLNEQLQTALTTRISIEQAKGVLAERGGVNVERAFELMRVHARATNQRLVDLARAVLDGADTAALFNPGSTRKSARRSPQ